MCLTQNPDRLGHGDAHTPNRVCRRRVESSYSICIVLLFVSAILWLGIHFVPVQEHYLLAAFVVVVVAVVA